MKLTALSTQNVCYVWSLIYKSIQTHYYLETVFILNIQVIYTKMTKILEWGFKQWKKHLISDVLHVDVVLKLSALTY